MLEISIIVSFTVFFIHVTTWEGMINEWVNKFFWDAPSFVKKPSYECPVCMTPWWGLPILLFSGWHPANCFQPFIVLASSAGMNMVIKSIVDYYGRERNTEIDN